MNVHTDNQSHGRYCGSHFWSAATLFPLSCVGAGGPVARMWASADFLSSWRYHTQEMLTDSSSASRFKTSQFSHLVVHAMHICLWWIVSFDLNQTFFFLLFFFIPYFFVFQSVFLCVCVACLLIIWQWYSVMFLVTVVWVHLHRPICNCRLSSCLNGYWVVILKCICREILLKESLIIN